MTSSLVSRLQEIPGIASVAVDLTDSGGGINVRLEPGADEIAVMERLRSVLVAYGVRSADPKVSLGRSRRTEAASEGLGVDVAITPLKTGARIEVATKSVKSFRVVPANPAAIAQGLSDAWCQVIGKIPVEITKISLGDTGLLTVTAFDGSKETSGTADVAEGWEHALTIAVGQALGVAPPSSVDSPPMAVNS